MSVFSVEDKHLQTVLYVGVTGVRVKVEREYLYVRILLFEAFHDTASTNVVGQAAEGLQYDECLDSEACVVDYFGSHQPTFSTTECVGNNVSYSFVEFDGTW